MTNPAERLRCAATRPAMIGGALQQCRKPVWTGHGTEFCYSHARLGGAKMLTPADLTKALAERAAGREEAVERLRPYLTHTPDCIVARARWACTCGLAAMLDAPAEEES